MIPLQLFCDLLIVCSRLRSAATVLNFTGVLFATIDLEEVPDEFQEQFLVIFAYHPGIVDTTASNSQSKRAKMVRILYTAFKSRFQFPSQSGVTKFCNGATRAINQSRYWNVLFRLQPLFLYLWNDSIILAEVS